MKREWDFVSAFVKESWLSSLWLLIYSGILIKWLYDERLRSWLTGGWPLYVAAGLYAVAVVLAVWLHRVMLNLSWFSLGAILVFIWLSNSAPPWQHKLVAVVVVCFIFFILEGMELAYTELRDKDPERLPDYICSPVQQINMDRSVFYDARELLVVLLVVLLTVWSDFDKMSLPIVGPTSERKWTLGFSLIFTSVLLIWFAQGPSKQLATRNSTGFLRTFGFTFVWRFVLKPIGMVMRKLRVNAPGELIVERLERARGLGAERNLPPSRHSFYTDALRCYGYSHHFAEDTITVLEDGSGTFEHRCLTYITSAARRSAFSHRYVFDAPIHKIEKAEVAIYSVPVFGETMSLPYNECLRAIFEQRQLSPGFQLHTSGLREERELTPDRKDVKFTFHATEPLPGSLLVGGVPAPAAVLRVHLIIALSPGCFCVPSILATTAKDHWYRRMALPCGEYKFQFELKGRDELRIANFTSKVSLWDQLHPSESDRVTKGVQPSEPSHRNNVIQYPLTGADYKFEWEVWRS